MKIENITMLIGSIGFLLMGLFALYISTKQNKEDGSNEKYTKINGALNLIIGLVGSIISVVSIINSSLTKICIIIFIITILANTIIQLFLSKRYRK